MRDRFDPPEEYEPEELCEHCKHYDEDGYCSELCDVVENQATDCNYFDYNRPTKQEIEEERGDYLYQCAKDERAERRMK